MAEALPWPRYLSEYELSRKYAQTLQEDASKTAALAKSITESTHLKAIVVLTPFLATDDSKWLENYFEQYSKQEQLFSIILFPNASLEVDPQQEAVAASVKEIERLSALHPHMDVRWITDPSPAATFTSIGAVRKLLWDVALLASHDSRSKSLFSQDLSILTYKKEYSLEEIVNIYPVLTSDYIFINHDIDVVYMPKNFMRDYIKQMVTISINTKGHNQPVAFNSSMKHARTPDHPHIDALASLHDYLYNSIHSGFEAGMAIRANAYGSLGGFKNSSYTYEVAGFANQIRNAIAYIRTSKLETSPRRFYEKLHHVNVHEIWGKPAAGVYSDFNDKDTCRTHEVGDITQERKDDLLREWAEVEDFAVFIANAAYYDHLYAKETLQICSKEFKDARTEEELALAKKHVSEVITDAVQRRVKLFERILSWGGFTVDEDFMKPILEKVATYTQETIEADILYFESQREQVEDLEA